jgi:hypothetical protein
MAWSIRMIDPASGASPEIGDMWPCDYWPSRWLSAYYDMTWREKRLPMMVWLPCGSFCIDTCFIKNGDLDPERAGWVVTGEPPLVTLVPSINIVGLYHGWIHDGIISDDCDGRQFPNNG